MTREVGKLVYLLESAPEPEEAPVERLLYMTEKEKTGRGAHSM